MSGHVYLSTGCLHGDLVLPDGHTGHEYCQSDTGAAGVKTPAVCKFCDAPCSCPCHEGVDMAGLAAPEFSEDSFGVWTWACSSGRCVPQAGDGSVAEARRGWRQHHEREHLEGRSR